MPQLIAEEAGVRLEFYEVAPTKSSGKGGQHYKLKTMRPNLPRVFADRAEAELAYAREVEASWSDPMIARLYGKGRPRKTALSPSTTRPSKRQRRD